MHDCQYCEEFEIGHFKIGGVGILRRMLFESENFVVFPSLGQIVEGYLLIATKKHLISMGSLDSGLYKELDDMQQRVRKVLTENYQSPLFFEHGPASSMKRGGCCIEHAHIHAVPVKVDVLSELARHFECKEINSLESLKQQSESRMPYLFFEDNEGKRYLFNVTSTIPSQYIRQLIAVNIGRQERWDWRSYYGLDEMVRTIGRLEGKF